MLFLCVNMTSKRGNKKQPTDTSEEDFEAFVRESLARLCEGQEKIIQDIANLKAKVQQDSASGKLVDRKPILILVFLGSTGSPNIN